MSQHETLRNLIKKTAAPLISQHNRQPTTERTEKMTIAQGIAHNKLKKLNSKRMELVTAFNRAAFNHRDVTGRYVRGSHSGCEYMLSCLVKVDAEIAKWMSQR